MDRTPERHAAFTETQSTTNRELNAAAARAARDRRVAAWCLGAAAATDDPAERESLRRRAADLLAPRSPADAADATAALSRTRPRAGIRAQSSCFL